jgi:hypothetical protein
MRKVLSGLVKYTRDKNNFQMSILIRVPSILSMHNGMATRQQRHTGLHSHASEQCYFLSVGSFFFCFLDAIKQNMFLHLVLLAVNISGAAAVPGAAGGMFFGGFICNRMKLKVRGMFRFAIITCILTVLAVNILWISCDQVKMAGVNEAYESG